ncbi:MAG: IclR family transcriptional regulator [Actinobacteria bacterium]|nr:IclR family transcriptional regulator [Actinomycetota bacterium]
MGRGAVNQGRRSGVDSHVRSVGRAVAILEQFTLDRPEPTLTEISTEIGLSKSTTHRLLTTLEAAEMVEFDRKSLRYRLGLKVFRLGSVASKGMDLVRQAEPLLRSIAEETDETSLLLVADGHQALCLLRFDGDCQVRVLFSEPGKHSAFNIGAAQRVLLAHLPDDVWEEVVAHHVRHMTQYSLVARDELERDRREIQEHGYAVSWEDIILYTCGLGAPVRDAEGSVVAAVSISGIVQRFSAERLPLLIRRVMQLGDDLSHRLGYAERGAGR